MQASSKRVILTCLLALGGCIRPAPQEKASLHNAALATCGTEAELTHGERVRGAVEALIDGSVSDDSVLLARNLPVAVVLTFAQPTEVHTVRVYHGHCGCAVNPSGECGIRAFRIEGWVNGAWKPLGATVRNIPGFHLAGANGPEDYFLNYPTEPELVNQLRLTILETNDTGCRLSSPETPIIPPAERVAYIREIEVMVPGEAPRKQELLSDRLQGDFRLPAFRNVPVADLHLFPTEIQRDSLPILIAFQERSTGHVPAPPLRPVVRPYAESAEQVVPIDISDWPDGEYLVTITAAGSNGPQGDIVRMIRKRDMARPVPPPGPIDVRGRTMFFMDNWYTETEDSGLTRRLNKAETRVILPKSPDPDNPFIRTSGLEQDAEGCLYLTIRTGKNAHEITGPRYRATSANGRDWILTKEGK